MQALRASFKTTEEDDEEQVIAVCAVRLALILEEHRDTSRTSSVAPVGSLQLLLTDLSASKRFDWSASIVTKRRFTQSSANDLPKVWAHSQLDM